MADQPAPPELINLPDLPLQKIAENAPFRGVLNMKKVCARFHDLFEQHPPSINLVHISITGSQDAIRISYGQGCIGINYKKDGDDGCIVTTRFEKKDLKFANEDYKEMFRADLERNARLQTKPLYSFSINADDVVMKLVSSVLEAVKPPLKAETVYITTKTAESAGLVLRLLCPTSLKTLEIKLLPRPPTHLSDAQVSQLASCEQWKSAKNIELKHCVISNDSLHHFAHLSKSQIALEEFSIQSLVELKEMILRPSLEKLILRNTSSVKDDGAFMLKMLEDVLGSHTYTHGRIYGWFFNAPHGNEDLLYFQLNDDTLMIMPNQEKYIPYEIVVRPMFKFPDN